MTQTSSRSCRAAALLGLACLLALPATAADWTSKRDIGVTQPTPVKEVYRQIGELFDLEVLFDPKLQNQRIEIELQRVTARQALQGLALACHHFYKMVDDDTVLIAEDTPQKRRQYEELLLKVYRLENLSVKNADKILRSLVEARRLATEEDSEALAIRDSRNKIEIIDRLLEIVDRPFPEIEVEIAGLWTRPGLAAALQRYARRGGSSARLSPEQLEKLLDDGLLAPAAVSRLSLVGSGTSRLTSDLGSGELRVELSGRAHVRSEEITLNVDVSPLNRSDQDRSEDTPCAVKLSVRLPAGVTYLVGPVPADSSPDGSSYLPALLIALTPRIVRGGSDPDLPDTLVVGTEARVSLDASGTEVR